MPLPRRASPGDTDPRQLANPSPPGYLERTDLLEHADLLLYSRGIARTSMRDIAAAAHKPLRRLRRYYPTKQSMVVAYLSRRHEKDLRLLQYLRNSELDPSQVLEAALDGIVDDLVGPGFRGCAFLNAAVECGEEYPDVRAIVREHRDWYATETTELLRDAGHPRPADAADDLVLARDGGMASPHGGNIIAAVVAMRRVILRTYDEIKSSPSA